MANGGGGAPKVYIVFEDPAVEAICVANWSSDGIGLTYEDAAAVTSIGTVFQNTTITKFMELNYFTGVTSLGGRTSNNSSSAFTGSTLMEVGLENITSLPSGYNLSSLSLTSVYMPNVVTMGRYAMNYCTNLQKIEIGGSLTTLSFGTWGGCSSLTTAIFHSVSPPTMSIQNFGGTPIANGTGFIYVPDNSVAAYQAASQWSSYASQIKGLSEYPV